MEGVRTGVSGEDALARRSRSVPCSARPAHGGLRTILESILLDTMYELPSMTNAKSRSSFDEAVVTGETTPYIIYRVQANRRPSATSPDIPPAFDGRTPQRPPGTAPPSVDSPAAVGEILRCRGARRLG